MGKIAKRLITGFLCVALIIGFVPNFNVPVKAESKPITITQEDFDDALNNYGVYTEKGIKYDGNDLYYLNNGSYVIEGDIDLNGFKILLKNVSVSIVNNGSVKLLELACENSSVTLSGNGSYTSDFFAVVAGNDTDLKINSGTFIGRQAGLYIYSDGKATLSGGTYKSTDSFYPLNSVEATSRGKIKSAIIVDSEYYDEDATAVFNSLLASDCEYSPSSIQFSYSKIDENYDFKVYCTDQAIIQVKKNNTTPDNKEITPEDNNSNNNNNNNNNKKTYKNEWVDHQWYDANGNASYKYKGYWKCNDKGWWFEDENGWFPQDQWQKIDGKWYFFDAIGYMAQNEYAGSWSTYSEGNWWVGDDGAWDGSEPGVWRLSSNGKWWFKDSTGWFAKSKWYKIRGTWYYFDDEGWWDESKTE